MRILDCSLQYRFELARKEPIEKEGGEATLRVFENKWKHEDWGYVNIRK